MILLNTSHPVLADQVKRWLESEGELLLDNKLTDFDMVAYHVSSTRDKVLRVSMRVQCWPEVVKHGGEAYIKGVFGAFVAASPEATYSLTLELAYAAVPAAAGERDTLIAKISELKRHVLCAPLAAVFDSLRNNRGGQASFALHYRDVDTMYVSYQTERIVVTLSVAFSEVEDIAMARVFLQEFAEMRKTNTSAPTCTFRGETPPTDACTIDPTLKQVPNVNYMTFVFEERHLRDTRYEQALRLVSGFRNFIHYHLKCTKAFMHQRMRSRVDTFMQYLRRAHKNPTAPSKRAAVFK